MQRRRSKSGKGREGQISQHGVVVRRAPRPFLGWCLAVIQGPGLIGINVPGLGLFYPWHQRRAGEGIIESPFLALVAVCVMVTLPWEARVITVHQAGETGFPEPVDRSFVAIAVDITGYQHWRIVEIPRDFPHPRYQSISTEGSLLIKAAPVRRLANGPVRMHVGRIWI